MTERPPAVGPDLPAYDPEGYSYDLPPERIAFEPAQPRDASRLLVLRRNEERVDHRSFHELPDLLDPGDLLVVNETRVVPARLHGAIRGRGREVEVLLIRELSPGRWTAWVRPAASLRSGDVVAFDDQPTHLRFLERRAEEVEFAVEGDVSALLAACGEVPLPPYIRRPPRESDREDYQTVFARVPGAVAAPTAGLHFTPRLLEELVARGIGLARLTLHVGPGTFRPIRVEDIRDHKVEPEYYEIPEPTRGAVVRCRARGGRILAVGTTTVRALEAWQSRSGIDTESDRGWTDLTIRPPFRFRAVDSLLTNFHLPRSSLLLLVCAFAGRERVLGAYREAVGREYRFYSYGDAMLIL